MGQTRKLQAQQASETALEPSELALLERFRRLKDKQKNFVSRSIDLLLRNESVRPARKAEHAFLAVKWRAKGDRPIKTIDECIGIWENPTGQRFNVADQNSSEIVGVEDIDVPG